MKKTSAALILIFLLSISLRSFSQTETSVPVIKMDTIVTKKNTTIIGKITKVSDTEIEYKKVYEPDAPVYVVNKDKLKEIRWGNGTVERITSDEMDVNKELEIIDKRSAIKFNFFSPVNDQLKFSYEHSLKVGTNIEVTAGIINNSMFKSSIYSKVNLIQGGTLAVGVKFLLGQDYYIKGMKYTHPLKGRFIKPEIAYSGYSIRGLKLFTTTNNYYTSTIVTSDKTINSVAFMLNYGRQFILGNAVTVSYSLGAGYSYFNARYSNPAVNISNTSSPYYYSEYDQDPTNLYTHLRISNLPIAVNGSVTIGYVFK